MKTISQIFKTETKAPFVRVVFLILVSLFTLKGISQDVKSKLVKSSACSAVINGHKGGEITVNELKESSKVEVDCPGDFEIISFVLCRGIFDHYIEVLYRKDDPFSGTSVGKDHKAGTHFTLKNIFAKSKSTGERMRLPDLDFKVVK